jgi:hypothetical protein
MFESESRCGDDINERFLDGGPEIDSIADKSAWDARRRIERLRELRRLRELLDDPDFDDLD